MDTPNGRIAPVRRRVFHGRNAYVHTRVSRVRGCHGCHTRPVAPRVTSGPLRTGFHPASAAASRRRIDDAALLTLGGVSEARQDILVSQRRERLQQVRLGHSTRQVAEHISDRGSPHAAGRNACGARRTREQASTCPSAFAACRGGDRGLQCWRPRIARGTSGDGDVRRHRARAGPDSKRERPSSESRFRIGVRCAPH